MYGGKRDPQYICFPKKTPPPVSYQERSRKSFVVTTTLHALDVLRLSALHPHHLIHGQHVLVQMVNDPERAADDQRDDKDTESQRQHRVGIVRSGRDVQKEN